MVPLDLIGLHLYTVILASFKKNTGFLLSPALSFDLFCFALTDHIKSVFSPHHNAIPQSAWIVWAGEWLWFFPTPFFAQMFPALNFMFVLFCTISQDNFLTVHTLAFPQFSPPFVQPCLYSSAVKELTLLNWTLLWNLSLIHSWCQCLATFVCLVV